MKSPIRRRKLYEEVAAWIEEMIATGRFPPGSHLPPEKDLALELGVGRSAVREAMLSLQSMGLIAVSSGERARVVEPSPDVLIQHLGGAVRLWLSRPKGLRDLQQARKLFEIGLARHAAQCASDGDLARLKAALDANEAAIGDPPRFRQTDVEFHYVIASIPANSIFTSMHEALVTWLYEQRQVSGQASGAGDAAHTAHRAIYDAIASHDPEAAAAAMEAHLDAVHRLYWQMREAEEIRSEQYRPTARADEGD